jgi:hypothetical protein
LKSKVFDIDDQSNQTNVNQENENLGKQEASGNDNLVATNKDRDDTGNQEHQQDNT